MMKCKKITAPGDVSIEDAVNQFFKLENISKHDVVHIRPITMNSGGGMSDLWCVYIFYDKYNAAEQSTQ